MNSFQDDTRENRMRKLFDLYKDETEGRSGVDAFLEIDGQTVPFELKTTSKGSVTTVRDFSPDHIKKWENKHWLIGFYINNREFYKYGSPLMMKEWIQSKEKYIATDFQLASLVSSRLTLRDLYQVVGKKSKYSYEDAKSIQKNQYLRSKYISLQDMESGYSPKQMLAILKDRVKYLVERGSTLNNPHIPLSYFDGWTEITENHAKQLRLMVKDYLSFKVL